MYRIYIYILFCLIDGNHKLVRWKMIIHAGIDGYSRLIVYMKCSNNNKATTVLDLFTEATKSYFVPSKVRSDKGSENVKVAEFMLSYRGFDRGSMIQFITSESRGCGGICLKLSFFSTTSFSIQWRQTTF